MSTRACTVCGEQYLGWVTRCTNCGVALVDVPDAAVAGADPAEGGTVLDVPEADQVVYELFEWTGVQRLALARELDAAGIVHAWDGSDLVVSVADEAGADEIVERVEIDGVPDEGADAQVLDGDQLAYELDEWSPEEREQLTARLAAAGLAFEWEGSTLVVRRSDEQAVEDLLDAVEFPDELPADPESGSDDGDGDVAFQVMSGLFLAADRLQHDPRDPDGISSLAGALDGADAATPPYGVDPRQWATIVGDADLLADAVADEADDVTDRAESLRVLLRPLV